MHVYLWHIIVSVNLTRILICFEEVVASGVWISPGDSEEVATALSQSLRNRIERSLYINKSKVLGVKFTMCIFDNYFIGIYRVLSGFAYMRFGDVFSKFHPSQNEELLRYLIFSLLP